MKILANLFKTCVAVYMIGILTGCSNEETTPITDQVLSNNSWAVTYFFDKDKDETSDFVGFTFKFETDGKAIADNGVTTKAGSWSIISDDGHRKFVLDFGLGRPLEELNDDWIIVEESSTVIKLRDDNDTHLEELHFAAK